ncbi:RNA-directed DNA polymerase, eukaryota, reverse transcriptase zinc-binding domain protein [Tanacetum coccineum]
MSSSTKQDEVVNLIAAEKLHICAILESHLKSSLLEKVCSKIFGHWNWDSNMKFSDKDCRIMVGWNSANINMACVCASKQSMLCIVKSTNNKIISFFTFVYAANGGSKKRELWLDINRHKAITNGHPWAISGDFNVTLYPNEHSAGSSSVTADMMEFKECINQVEFANYITDKEEIYPIVNDKWKADMGGMCMYNLVKKLKSLKHPLNNLNWSNGNLIEKVKALKEELKCVQTAIDVDPYDKSLREKRSAILESYLEAVKDEEKLLFQKCKIKWLSYGDKNNSYFHKMLKGRNQRNRIQVIHDPKGQRFEGDQVATQFVNHFQNFLGINMPVSPISDCEELFTTKLFMEDANQMVMPITDKEIRKAMFSIDDNKAPGPDGYSARFFKKAWHIVGEDVCKAVKEFFTFGKLLGEINATIFSLIPKINTPLLVTDFRPIACCNVIYKCISKVIT